MAAVLSTLRMDPAIAAVALATVLIGNVLAMGVIALLWIDRLMTLFRIDSRKWTR